MVLSLAACGAFKGQSNYLQSITLNVTLINGQAPSGQTGFVNLVGNGGTIQLQAIGNYTDKKTVDLTNQVTYNVTPDPDHNIDAFGNLLLPPCQPGSCPAPGSGPPYTSGTVEYSPTGLLTAVEPATCTYVDVAPLDSKGVPEPPAWYYVGDYVVTVTFEGVTSQPIYVPIASSAGDQYYGGQENNPAAYCDSGTYSG